MLDRFSLSGVVIFKPFLDIGGGSNVGRLIHITHKQRTYFNLITATAKPYLPAGRQGRTGLENSGAKIKSLLVFANYINEIRENRRALILA